MNMAKEDFNTEQELGKTRDSLDKPIGMILLSLAPEVLSGDKRNALMTAQAAVRAANLADKITAFATDPSAITPKDFVRHDDPIFKYINGEKDADIVKRAQNLWFSTQMSLNFQITSLQAGGTAQPLTTGHTDSVAASSAGLLNEAAVILAAENEQRAADKLTALATSISPATRNDAVDAKVADDNKFTRATLDKPLGDLLVGMLNIDPEVKNALLMGQAAVRAVLLADKAADFVADSQNIIDANKAANTTIEPAKAGVVPFDDQIFKFVGSPRDPAGLQNAQGLWMSAQMLLNYQVGTVQRAIDNGPRTAPLNEEFGNGIKQAAAIVLQQAADTLTAKGHVKASEKMSALGDAIGAAAKADTAVPPSHTLAAILHFDPAVKGNDAFEAKLRQLSQLTATAPRNGGSAPSPSN